MTDIEKFNIEYDFFLDNIDGITLSYDNTRGYIEKIQVQLTSIHDKEARASFLFLIGLSGLNFMMDNCQDFSAIGVDKINEILHLGNKSIKEAYANNPTDEIKFVEILYTVLDIDDLEVSSKTMLTCPNPYSITTNLMSPEFLAMLANFVAQICGVENWTAFSE